MDLNFEKDATDFIVKAFGFSVDDEGNVTDENGNIAKDITGNKATVNNIIKILDGKKGGTILVTENPESKEAAEKFEKGENVEPEHIY